MQNLELFKAPVKMADDFPDVLIETERQTVVMERSQIYIHCHFKNGPAESGIRIWKTTYVIDCASGIRGELLHAENITYAPEWTWLSPNKAHSFLLIFAGLPSSCVSFDLVEDIGEPNGFFVGGILRNRTDVYHVNLGG